MLSRVQIQILLYMILLELPGPSPDVLDDQKHIPSISAPSPSPQKRRRVDSASDDRPPPLDDCLEAFMDRLSMWQLMGSIEGGAGGDAALRGKGKDKQTDDRDWMQVFCEDIVREGSVAFHIDRTPLTLL